MAAATWPAPTVRRAAIARANRASPLRSPAATGGASAPRDGQVLVLDGEWHVVDAMDQLVGDAARVVDVGVDEQDAELVAAEAADRVVAAHGGAHARGELGKHLVADLVAVAEVDAAQP